VTQTRFYSKFLNIHEKENCHEQTLYKKLNPIWCTCIPRNLNTLIHGSIAFRILRPVSVVAEQVAFKLWPCICRFPYPSFFLRTPCENDELRYHCNKVSLYVVHMSRKLTTSNRMWQACYTFCYPLTCRASDMKASLGSNITSAGSEQLDAVWYASSQLRDSETH
jgi:hypothetical protein